jgi:hypothetical protein
MGLPLLESSSAVGDSFPSFTVCSWTLNWGRIFLQNVTIKGVDESTAERAMTAPLLVLDPGEWVHNKWVGTWLVVGT